MLADNLQTYSFTESVARTFDGKYLCPICKAIAAGKRTEHNKGFTAQMQKIEFPPAKANPVLFAPSQFVFLPQLNFSLNLRFKHRRRRPRARSSFSSIAVGLPASCRRA